MTATSVERIARDGLWIGRGLQRLVPARLEVELARAHAFLLHGNVSSRPAAASSIEWSDQAKNGVLFDLSAVEWIEVGALVHLTVLVENALRTGLPTVVALPLPHAREDESEWAARTPAAQDFNPKESLESLSRTRRHALNFLEYLQFPQAVAPPHLEASAELVPNFDKSQYVRPGQGDTSEEDARSDASERPAVSPRAGESGSDDARFRYDVPLTWVSREDAQQRQQLAKFAAAIVGDPQRGVQEQLAKTIANVLLYELVENTATHARTPPRALVAVCARREGFLIPDDTRKPPPRDFLDYEKDYIDWIVEQPKPVIEVVVGDSGCGVFSQLAPVFEHEKNPPTPFSDDPVANVVAWAFDRWSSSLTTSDDRGTRGLYRVDRVVKKAQGLIAVRAVDRWVGWDHGGPGHDELIRATHAGMTRERPVALSPAPGTIVRVRLPAFQQPVFHQRQSPLLQAGSVEPARRHAGASPRAPAPASASAAPVIVKVGPVLGGGVGLAKDDDATIRDAVSRASRASPQPPVLAIVAGGVEDKTSLEKYLRRVVEIRHPPSLALYGLPGGRDLVDSVADSINQSLVRSQRGDEALRDQHHEIWDPVQLIHADGSVSWVGTAPSVARVLDALVMAGGRLSPDAFQQMIPGGAEGLALLGALRVDTQLVQVDPHDQSLLLKPPMDVSRFFAEGLWQLGKRKPFWSPSLVPVSRWVDIPAALSTLCGIDLAAMLLAEKARPLLAPAKRCEDLLVVADANADADLVEKLANDLPARHVVLPGYGGTPIPSRTPVFPPGTHVVVFCEVLASGDTARRTLRQVRRDKAIPDAVVCVIDSRTKPGEPVDAWGRRVPVAALAALDLHYEGDPDAYIDPVFRREEASAEEPQLDRELSRDIDAVRALHLGHYGELLARHFTLYLDAAPLLRVPSVVNAFEEAAREWLSERQDDASSLDIWYPAPEPKPAGPARYTAEALRDRLSVPEGRVFRVERHSRRLGWLFDPRPPKSAARNVLIVDWGALTGESIAQMVRLAAAAGAKAILDCVFVSQLQPEDEAFLCALREVSGRSQGSPGQIPLAYYDEAEVERRSPVPCRIRFLRRLPLHVYGPLDCPTCEQLDRLRDEQERLPPGFLRDFLKGQCVRLRLRSRQEIEAEQSVSTEVIRIRQRLAAAQGSTRLRVAIDRELGALAASLETAQDPPPAALAYVRLLSVEHQWLACPPLVFEKERARIADAFLKVALNPRLSDEERADAVACLRMASKVRFAEALPDLIKASAGNTYPRLLQQVAFNTATCLRRPYQQSPKVAGAIKAALAKTASVALPAEATTTFAILRTRAEVEVSDAEVAQMPPPLAWRCLRRRLLDDQDDPNGGRGYDMLSVLLRPFEEIIERAVHARAAGEDATVSEGAMQCIAAAAARWRECRDWLDGQVFPLLRVLPAVLESWDLAAACGPHTVSRIRTLCTLPTISESSFSLLMEEVARSPGYLLDAGNWRLFQAEARWYYESLLKHDPPSPFREFFGAKPTNLREAFAAAYVRIEKATRLMFEAPGWTSAFDKHNPPVFCPEALAVDALFEVLRSTNAHCGSALRELHLDVRPEPDGSVSLLQLWIDAMPPLETAIEGIERIVERLRPFGGDLRGAPLDRGSGHVAELRLLIEPQ